MRKQKDISLKHFLEKEDIFCELFNQTVFRDGALHLLAEKLVPVDTRASIRILDADSNVEFFERYRDVVKYALRRGPPQVGRVLKVNCTQMQI